MTILKKKKKTVTATEVIELDDTLNDFGFSSYTKEEIDNNHKTKQIYDVLINLLNQLEKDPDKEYIFWPNRQDKIKEIKDKINKIYTE